MNETPRGSLISGLITEAVKMRLKTSSIPKIWIRYVDDTFVITKRTSRKVPTT